MKWGQMFGKICMNGSELLLGVDLKENQGPEKFNRLGRENKLTICWVTSHGTILGNKRGEELAKIGVSKPLMRSEYF